MGTTQITSCCPKLYVRDIPQSRCLSSKPCVLPIHTDFVPRIPLALTTNSSHHLQAMPVLKHQQNRTVCFFGGKGGMEGGNGGSPWQGLKNVFGRFKGKSLEDELREQVEKKKFYDDSGSGSGRTRPPGGGGGGGGGDRGDGFGGSEDEGLAGIIDETVQVILATAGFIFLYVYIINGEEIIRLGKDYIKYLFGGSPSARLRRIMYKWGKLYKTENKNEDKYSLEKAIINTTTWWDSPEKYRRFVKALSSESDE